MAKLNIFAFITLYIVNLKYCLLLLVCTFYWFITWYINFRLTLTSFKSCEKYCYPIEIRLYLMLNCCCKIVDRRKTLSFAISRNDCKGISLSQTSDTMRAVVELVQGLSSGFIEGSCALVVSTTRWNAMSFREFLNWYYWLKCKFGIEVLNNVKLSI